MSGKIQNNELLDGSIKKNIMILAWPAIIEMLMATLVQFVDTAMVSSLGPVGIAAVAINMSPMWLLNGMFMGLSVGTTALVARHIGAGEPKEAAYITRQSMIIGVIGAAVLSASILLFGQKVPVFMGAEEEVLAPATDYIKIISATFILSFTSFIVASALRGAGDTKTPMRINIISNVVNVIGNFFLIFPSRNISLIGMEVFVPGAGMGVAGAALATSVSRGLAGLLMVIKLYGRNSVIKPELRGTYLPDIKVLKRILHVGLPSAVERITLSLGQVLFTRIVAGLGTIQLAAHHIAIVAEAISYMPGFGFSIAATTLVGQMLGAGRPQKAEVYGKETLKLGVLVMSVMGIVFLVFPGFLMRIFTNDPEVIGYGVVCLRIIALCQPFFASTMIQAGALRGAGDTRWPLYITIICMWGVRLLTAWFFVYVLDLGLMGAWFGMALDFIARGILMFIRFNRGDWKNIEV